MVEFAVPEIDYTRYSNRQLAAVPLAVLGAALFVVLAWYLMTGSPVDLGMAFTGGTEVRFTTGDSLEQVRVPIAELTDTLCRILREGWPT